MMRTYVRMGLGPYRPIRELEHAITRGNLGMAIAIAKDVAREYGRPIDLHLALKLLPLVATQQLDAYNHWARRWLTMACNAAL